MKFSITGQEKVSAWAGLTNFDLYVIGNYS